MGLPGRQALGCGLPERVLQLRGQVPDLRAAEVLIVDDVGGHPAPSRIGFLYVSGGLSHRMPQRVHVLVQLVLGKPTSFGIQNDGLPTGETEGPFVHQVVEGGRAGAARVVGGRGELRCRDGTVRTSARATRTVPVPDHTSDIEWRRNCCRHQRIRYWAPHPGPAGNTTNHVPLTSSSIEPQ
jgi:hypothetical protein